MTSFKKDYNFGKECENKVLEMLNKYFKTGSGNPSDGEIRASTNIYSSFDFYGDKYIYELKSRNNSYNDYPTTLIPKYKCKDNLILLFYFTDGLYYIEYKSELFNKFELKMFKRNDRVDKIEKPVEYYYIPITNLTKIDFF
jgi:hypothetical protein